MLICKNFFVFLSISSLYPAQPVLRRLGDPVSSMSYIAWCHPESIFLVPSVSLSRVVQSSVVRAGTERTIFWNAKFNLFCGPFRLSCTGRRVECGQTINIIYFTTMQDIKKSTPCVDGVAGVEDGLLNW